MSTFRWYRRWRRGKWAQVTGLMWGRTWARVPCSCRERVDENYSEK